MNKKTIEIIEPVFVEYTGVCFYNVRLVQTINALFRPGTDKVFLADRLFIKEFFLAGKI